VDFDHIVVVDWSASSTPTRGRDSIWIAQANHHGTSLENLATRAQAFERLRSIVDERAGSSVLIGVDFSLGYPRGTAAALGLKGTPWHAMWGMLAEAIIDDDHNDNNRFAVAADLNAWLDGGPGPFWGCPPSQASATLGTRKPPAFALPQWRVVEEQLRRHGHRPFSSWQLLGAGAVGSQSLVGIPVIERLRRHAPDRVAVWPFTTGLGLTGLRTDAVVVAEVWPSMIDVDPGVHPVRDACQVHAVATWLGAAQSANVLDAMFSPSLPSDVSTLAVAEEGWVLGTAFA
jgi:hypothetical protein